MQSAVIVLELFDLLPYLKLDIPLIGSIKGTIIIGSIKGTIITEPYDIQLYMHDSLFFQFH